MRKFIFGFFVFSCILFVGCWNGWSDFNDGSGWCFWNQTIQNPKRKTETRHKPSIFWSTIGERFVDRLLGRCFWRSNAGFHSGSDDSTFFCFFFELFFFPRFCFFFSVGNANISIAWRRIPNAPDIPSTVLSVWQRRAKQTHTIYYKNVNLTYLYYKRNQIYSEFSQKKKQTKKKSPPNFFPIPVQCVFHVFLVILWLEHTIVWPLPSNFHVSCIFEQPNPHRNISDRDRKKKFKLFFWPMKQIWIFKV